MIVKKQYLKTRPFCRVIFEIPPETANHAEKACIVGDFNNWDRTASPMLKRKDGSFRVTVNLEKGREYAFRYFIDGVRWKNADNADRFVPTPYLDAKNSVVVV